MKVTGMTRPRKNPGASENRTPDLPLLRRTPRIRWRVVGGGGGGVRGRGKGGVGVGAIPDSTALRTTDQDN